MPTNSSLTTPSPAQEQRRNMLSRATEKKSTVREASPEVNPAPKPVSLESKASPEIVQPSPAFGPGVTGMMGDQPAGDGEGGIGGSPGMARFAKGSAVLGDSAHTMSAPATKAGLGSDGRPTGWAPVEMVGQVATDGKEQPTSYPDPSLLVGRALLDGKSTDSAALAVLHEQLREERKRNERVSAELEQARKAAQAAEIALARCEAKLELKEEALTKLEAKLAAAA